MRLRKLGQLLIVDLALLILLLLPRLIVNLVCYLDQVLVQQFLGNLVSLGSGLGVTLVVGILLEVAGLSHFILDARGVTNSEDIESVL